MMPFLSYYLAGADGDMENCSCSSINFTNLADILEFECGPKVSDYHQKILFLITCIGCGFSTYGLDLVILTFISFKQWREEVRHKALFHLSIALSIFLTVFLLVVTTGDMSTFGCTASAVVMHYTLLASFGWMTVEAYLQYLSLVKVVGTYIPRFILKASLLGWGVPLLIVGTMIGIDINSYKNKNKFCWVSEKVFYYGVAGPILLLLVVNFGIFFVIIYFNTCGRSKELLRTNQTKTKQVIKRVKKIISVWNLLGLSWIFGFLAVGKAKVFFQYLFTVTVSLQGLIIFVFVIWREETRVLWRGLVFRKPIPKACNNGNSKEQGKEETEHE